MSRAGTDRGQLVLLAAAALAVALVPLVAAYLQLGYHADVTASNDYDAPVANAERLLDRAVHTAVAPTYGEYDWSERRDAVTAVQSRLDRRLSTLETARIESGTAYQAEPNATVAVAVARDDCPGGDGNRQFGSCEAVGNVVVQERAGETHVVAVTLDLTVTTERGVYETTMVFTPDAG